MNLAKTLKAAATTYNANKESRFLAHVLSTCTSMAHEGCTAYSQDCWTVHWQTVMALEAEGFTVRLQSWTAADGTYATNGLESTIIASGDNAMLVVSWA